MATTYQYRARNRKGQRVEGIILSRDAKQAVDRLRAQGYLVTDLREKRAGFSPASLFRIYFRASSKDLAIFCRQVSTMLAAGISLVNALDILEKQHINRHLRQAVGEVKRELATGSQMAEAMAKHEWVFPPVLVHMVEAGEAGGVLDEVLERMAQHFDKEQELKEKVKGALTYPVVISLVALLAVAFLVTFVLPTFAGLFAGSGLVLPLPTRILLAVSGFAAGNWVWLLGAALAVLTVGVRFLYGSRGRRIRDHFLLSLPVLGPVLQKVAVARFCRTLGTLLKGGVSLLAALEVVKNTAGNQVVTQAIERIREGVQRGRDMASLMEGSGIFPGMVVQMTNLGEETGSLDLMLTRIADYFEQEVDYTLARLSSLLEPALVLLVAGVVGFIVISIMLPMIDLVTVVG